MNHFLDDNAHLDPELTLPDIYAAVCLYEHVKMNYIQNPCHSEFAFFYLGLALRNQLDLASRNDINEYSSSATSSSNNSSPLTPIGIAEDISDNDHFGMLYKRSHSSTCNLF